MTLHIQFATMGWMFVCGLALGVVFDAGRVLTGQLRLPRRLVPPLDLLYWAAATAVVFRVLYHSNYGQVRIFVFLGLAAGISFHYCFTSGATVRSVQTLIIFIKKLFQWGVKLVTIFIVTPIVALYKFVRLILAFLLAAAIFLYKIVLQLVYPLLRLLSRLFVWLWRKAPGAGRFSAWVRLAIGAVRRWLHK